MCDRIESFMAYAENYCLEGPFLRRDDASSAAPYANLRIDACRAEGCVEVNRAIQFTPQQVRTVQALIHQTDVYLNGSSSNAGNLGISLSLVRSSSAREAALARLEYYAETRQLPSSCSGVGNPCEHLTDEQIEALREALQSETTPLSTKIIGGGSTALGAAYGIHLFHALQTSATGVPFLTGLGRVVRNDVVGAVRLAVPIVTSVGRVMALGAGALAGAGAAIQLAVAGVAGLGLGAAIHYSGLGHYIGTDGLGEHLGDWLAS